MPKALKSRPYESLSAQAGITAWTLQRNGAAFETATSWLQPVLSHHGPAMLKVLKPTSDEQNAAALLRYHDGVGAVRLFAADDKALVMERASGRRSLSIMTIAGEDEAAAEVLADTLMALHEERHRAPPASLEPLSERFSSLFAQEAKAPLLARAAGVAQALLSTQRDILPLKKAARDTRLWCRPFRGDSLDSSMLAFANMPSRLSWASDQSAMVFGVETEPQ